MPVNTNYTDDTILYAANLNSSFSQAANIAGDNFTGPLAINGVDIGSGLKNVYNATNAAFIQANTASGGGSATITNIYTYTDPNGNAYTQYTWTKAANTSQIKVTIMGAGGPGGNGVATTVANNCSGGAGGGGGSYYSHTFLASEVSNAALIRVGLNAFPGNNSTDSIFDVSKAGIVVYAGGAGGPGLISNTSGGGAGADRLANGTAGTYKGFTAISGGAGGTGAVGGYPAFPGFGNGGAGGSNTSPTGTAALPPLGDASTQGGASGGGLDASGFQYAGGTVDNLPFNNRPSTGTAGSAGGGNGGNANLSLYTIGFAGGGGGSSNTGPGGNAGISGWGAGGSGGGSCLTGSTPGLGGQGGPSYIIVIQS